MRTILIIAALAACTESDDGERLSTQHAAERWALALCERMAACLPETSPDVGACIEAITPQLLTECITNDDGFTECYEVDGAKPFAMKTEAFDQCIDAFTNQGACDDAAATGSLGPHPGCWPEWPS